MRTANDRGLRVIIDLVVNHTSVEHPWFQAARARPDSPYRDYYVWRTRSRRSRGAVAFPGEETSIWQHDRKAGAYYLHQLLPPSSPTSTSPTPTSATRSPRSWASGCTLGVSGFRIDAVPFLLQVENRAEASDFDPQAWLRALREYHAPARRGDADGRGQRRQTRTRRLPRGPRRRAAHAVRLPRQPGDLPVAGARRAPSRSRRLHPPAARPAGHAAGRTSCATTTS